MGSYIDQSDLEDTIGAQTVVGLFDDNNDGIADAKPVARVIASAEALVNAAIARAFPSLVLPVTQSPQSELLKEASLMFAIPLSYRRRPEYARTNGESNRGPSMMKQAFDYLEGLCTGKAFLFDVPAEVKPSTVGGVVYETGPRTMLDNSDGTNNSGDF
jgi:uncharacterized protein DUF1320